MTIMSSKNTEVYYPPFWEEAVKVNFQKFFESNWNNMKRSEILNYSKRYLYKSSRTLNQNNKTVTNLVEIANTFNYHFVSAAEKTRANVIYSHKHFSEYIFPNNSSNHSFYLLLIKMKFQSSFLDWIHSRLLVQIAYLQRLLNYLRIIFHLIFLSSIISLFLLVYSHQSW